MTIQERFWSKVQVTENRLDCWVWSGYSSLDGYGQFKDGKRVVKSHMFAYEQANGKIPDGFQVDYLCRNRACCNPSHLEAVTQQENIRRGEVGKYNSDKTHCPQGHEYSDANTQFRKCGRRRCRACARDYTAEMRNGL